MTTASRTVLHKNLGSPDETRAFAKGKIEVASLGEVTAGRSTFEPGWKWSECVKPLVGTKSCLVRHVGYVLSGRMHVLMDDGMEEELGPGDAAVIPPGHDAWIVGDDACVFLDFAGAGQYAK
ncbi:MAG TPA: cupin domain-containing protein [Chloroflexota bacterium]|nr:cupin domain-containing protein [Chloroflexota bacterium]